MIPKECKRLIEVDFPIAEVSRHSAREKSIRHGHPCTLHLWWARRPLAACRAVLMGLLLPDPCDPHCPPDFKPKARQALKPLQGNAKDDAGLRKALLKLIADFANWDNSSVPAYLEAARALVKAAHPEETPLVVDPFAGGGSIPLEALRVGCDAFASDLNPVACLILKVMLEDIPRYGNADFDLKDDEGNDIVVRGMADALRHVGRQIKKAAEKELAEFYPPDPDGASPIAYLWARTIRCEAPGCGAEIPLVRSFWLCKKAHRKRALRHNVERPRGKPPRVEFEVFEPRSDKDVPNGTVRRAKATCVCCGATLLPERVRAQLAAQRGGADTLFDAKGRRIGGARLLAVVTLRTGEPGRHYRLSADRDYRPVFAAQQAVAKLPKGTVPDEPTPAGGGSGAGRAFSVQKYGMMTWADLFTARQKTELMFVAEAVRARSSNAPVQEALSMALGRCADHWSSGAMWIQDLEAVAHTFGRQALPIVWDFVEAVGFGDGGATFEGQVDWGARVAEAMGSGWGRTAQVQLSDACRTGLPDESAHLLFTDPPYYDAIPYADLADYFFVWHKRALPGHHLLRDPFDRSNALTPKYAEIVQDEVKEFEGKPKDRAFFESRVGVAFAEGRRVLSEGGVGSIVFAHKTTEAWEALLSGLLGAGWTITASWPITTERGARLRARDSAALSASIHLVCRPRPENAGVGDWGEVLGALPKRINEWMDRLSSEGIRGADLVFSCIGPGLALFSQYERVETPDGEEVGLGPNPEAKGEPAKRGFLSYIWEVVGRTALRQILGTAEATAYNTAIGALEEDARLTALFLWTLQSAQTTGDNGEEDEEDGDKPRPRGTGFSLIFDIARRFAQPLGIHLEDWEGRIIKTEKGVVRLIPVVDRAGPLFGDEGAAAAGRRFEEAARRDPQQKFAFMEELEKGAVPEIRGPRRRKARGADVSEDPLRARREATTLDRVHVAMLLQSGGQSNALRAHLETEIARGPNFLRLANALSALYPIGSEEKRLLDAMLLAVPRR